VAHVVLRYQFLQRVSLLVSVAIISQGIISALFTGNQSAQRFVLRLNQMTIIVVIVFIKLLLIGVV
jgi:hypothetical protein